MKRIEKVGRIQPMITVEFYHKNPELWRRLKYGGQIDVPDEVFPLLENVKEVEMEVIVKKTKKKRKPKDKLEEKLFQFKRGK